MEAYQEQTPLETGDAFFYAHRHLGTAPGEMVGAHWHDAYELLFIRRGRGEQLLNARVLPFTQDDLIVIRPGDIHATWALSPDGCEIDEVMFDQRVLRLPDSSFFACTLTSQCPAACPQDAACLRALFETLLSEAELSQPGAPLIISGLLQQLAGWLLRAGCAQSGRRTHAVLSLLEQSPQFSLAEIAAHLGYAPAYLSRKIHAETGNPFRVLREEALMRRAVEALRRGESIAQTAETTGYSAPESFIRAFKRVYGLTPHQYISQRRPLGRER